MQRDWLGHRLQKRMTALQNKYCSRQYKATKEDGDQGTLGEETWSQKWGQWDSSTAGGRWRRQLKTEMDGNK